MARDYGTSPPVGNGVGLYYTAFWKPTRTTARVYADEQVEKTDFVAQ
jgi:hypothetical protein